MYYICYVVSCPWPLKFYHGQLSQDINRSIFCIIHIKMTLKWELSEHGRKVVRMYLISNRHYSRIKEDISFFIPLFKVPVSLHMPLATKYSRKKLVFRNSNYVLCIYDHNVRLSQNETRYSTYHGIVIDFIVKRSMHE